MDRREFLQVLASASAAGVPLAGCAGMGPPTARVPARRPRRCTTCPRFGNVSLLHFTDCHAQLLPIYFREPSVNIGVAEASGRAPHLVGEHLLKAFGIRAGQREAHAFTYLDFEQAASTYGKVGGFAHLATLVKRLRASRPGALLLDGGDTWQGSAHGAVDQRPGHGRRLQAARRGHDEPALGIHARCRSASRRSSTRTSRARSSSSRRTSRPPTSTTRSSSPTRCARSTASRSR